MRFTTHINLKIKEKAARGCGGNAPRWCFSASYFAFCFRRAAQNAFIRSDCALRAAAVMGLRFRRRFGAAFGAAAAVFTDAAEPFGGRPRRRADP
jgi:hypothetical protein